MFQIAEIHLDLIKYNNKYLYHLYHYDIYKLVNLEKSIILTTKSIMTIKNKFTIFHY